MTLIEQVATYLEDNLLLGTIGTNIFITYTPDSANTPDACISVLDTGGSSPDEYLPTKNPTFQVFIRDVDYDTGKAKLDAVRAGLHRFFSNYLVAGQTYFYYIFAISEGGHLGKDEAGRDLFSINFRCLTR
jgi:hypothetical protein